MCNLEKLLKTNKEVLLTGLITRDLYDGCYLAPSEDSLWIHQSTDEDGIAAQYVPKKRILKPGIEDNEGYLYTEIVIDEDEYDKCIAMLSLGMHLFDYVYQYLSALDNVEWREYV